MLRISVEQEGEQIRRLALEGKICHSWAAELRNEIEKILSSGKKVILDFAKVSYLDEEAARMLRLYPEERVEKRNCSLFIRTVLKLKEGRDD